MTRNRQVPRRAKYPTMQSQMNKLVIIPGRVVNDERLTLGALRLMIALNMLGARSGWIEVPTYPYLSAATGRSVRSLRSDLECLVETDYLEFQPITKKRRLVHLLATDAE